MWMNIRNIALDGLLLFDVRAHVRAHERLMHAFTYAQYEATVGRFLLKNIEK